MITRKPVVLLAPLDWGLGHTVRCIPIIKELLSLECKVIVACNSKQKQLLREEFSSIDFVTLKGYDIHYGKTRFQTLSLLFLQSPKIFNRIYQEKRWLEKFLEQNNVQAVIADNRYGLHSSKVPCIFITHQLRVKTGLGKMVNGIVQKILYSYINGFSACWIPDWKDSDINVAGVLSHVKKFPRLPVHYIGCLSRFEKNISHSETIDLLVILSGPEPQRTILERIIFSQLKNFEGRAVVVRGISGDHNKTPLPSNQVAVLDYAASTELNRLICSAEVVLTRAGYTSIMDILKLEKKSILIPTPGQAEQEYLAAYLHHKKLAYGISQKNFYLKKAMENARQLNQGAGLQSMDLYKKILREFVDSLIGNGIHQSPLPDFGKSKK
jgi:uncharacterized protein (TIGR00661 family)